MQGKGSTYSMQVGVQTGTVFWRSMWRVSQILKIGLPPYQVISLLGIYPKDSTSIHRDICSLMLIATLLIIARNRKQLRYPYMNEWIMKCGTFT